VENVPVICDEAYHGLIERAVFFGKIILRKAVEDIVQIEDFCIVVQIELQLPVLFHKVHLKYKK
jgi:hypothetical protein